MNKLAILQINIRSIVPKKDILEHYLEYNYIDIAMISETWLMPGTEILMKNYKVLTRSRSDGYGGVAILIHKNIKQSDCKQLKIGSIEIIESTIEINSKNLKIISFYIPPEISTRNLENAFKNLIHKYKDIDNFIMGGDVNAHNSLWENNSTNDRKGEIISEIITESEIVILNNGEHTYQNISKNYTSAIDITMVSRNLVRTCDWRVDENLTSDHFAIRIDLENFKPLNHSNKKIINFKKTVNCLNELDPSQTKNIENLENYIKRTLTENTQIIPINSKFIPKPWWNEKIKRLWLIKNFKQSMYNRFKNPYMAIELRKANNKLKNEIRKSKKISWEKFLNDVNPNCSSKELWNKINKIKNSKTYPKRLDSVDKIRGFLEFNFVEGTVDSFFEPLSLPKEDIFSPIIIENHIRKAKSTAPGSDGISFKLLKNLSSNYYETISKLFNNIWKSQKFPQNWKIIKVVGIPKIGRDHSNIQNYRPISLLPVFLKIFNKTIKNSIDSHLNTLNFLPERSFGFRKDFSTNDYFVNLLSEIEKNRNNQKTQVLVTVDFSKAFDFVVRSKLIDILKEINLNENICSWIDKFLSNRQMIYNNEDFSCSIKTSEGLPQGSCLSPILFNIYTSKLHQIESENVKLFQFADDFVLLVSTSNKNLLQRAVTDSLNNFITKSKQLNLKINIEKCSVLNLSRGKNKIKEITIDGKKVLANNLAKILGITFDGGLNFKKHHSLLVQGIKHDINLIKILSAIRGGIHPKISLQLYSSLIKPKIEYSALFTLYSKKSNAEILQKIKNAALRAALGLTRSTPVLSIMSLSATPTIEFEIESCMMKYIVKRTYINKYTTKVILDGNLKALFDLYNKYTILKKCPNFKYINKTCQNLKIIIPEIKSVNPIKAKLIALEQIEEISKENFYQIYTDASFGPNNPNRGIGIYHRNTKEEVALRIEESISIKSAEIIGIFVALTQAIKMKQNKICLFSDSMSSLKSISCSIEGNNQKYYENLIISLAYLNPDKEIILCWVPAHVGLYGNEMADKIAKRAVITGYSYNIKLEPKEIIKVILEKIWNVWDEYYRSSTIEVGSFLSNINDNKPAKKPWFQTSSLTHRSIKIINRLKTGHCYDGKFLYLMKKRDTNLCTECEVLDDFRHILLKCTKYTINRNRTQYLKQCEDINILLKHGGDLEYMEICDFLKEIEVCL